MKRIIIVLCTLFMYSFSFNAKGSILKVQTSLQNLYHKLLELKNTLQGGAKRLSELRWTFLNSTTHDQTSNKYLLNAPLPEIGHYDPGFYALARFRLIVALKPSMIFRIAEKNVLTTLAIGLGVAVPSSEEEFAKIFSKIEVKPYVIVYGTYFAPAYPPNQSYNIIFHGFLSKDYPQHTANFRANVRMGAFNQDGVEGASGPDAMPIGHLAERDVNFHEVRSPDNARIKVSAGRNISTFWNIGINAARTRAIVMYNLLINEQALEDQFVSLRDRSKYWLELLDNIGRLAEYEKIKNDVDKKAIANFVATLRQL